MSERIRAIKVRWRDTKQISTVDLEFLIAEAEKAETMRAADGLRKVGKSPLDDLFDGFFGGKR